MTRNFKTKIFILILILLGAFILYYSFQSKSPSPPVINTGLTDVEKENAAQAMNQQLKNVPPLTDKQKEDIANAMTKSLAK